MKTKKTHKPQDVRLLDLCTRFSFEVGLARTRPHRKAPRLPHQGEREKARRRRQMARDGERQLRREARAAREAGALDRLHDWLRGAR